MPIQTQSTGALVHKTPSEHERRGQRAFSRRRSAERRLPRARRPPRSGDHGPRGDDGSGSQSPPRAAGNSDDDRRSPRPPSPAAAAAAAADPAPRGSDATGGGRGGDGGYTNNKGRNDVGVSLLVRQLPPDARAEELEEAFSKYGKVIDVYIPRDYYTKRPKGIAFVQFPNPEEAADAERALDGTTLCGVENISVQVALQKRKDPSFFNRGRGGGGYRGGGGGGGYGGDRSRDGGRDRSRDRYNPYGGRDRAATRIRRRQGPGRDRGYDRRDRYDDRRDDYRRTGRPRAGHDYDDRR